MKNPMNYHKLIFTLLLVMSSLAMAAGDIDLMKEYRRLDEAIEQSDRYVKMREARIAKLKTALEVTKAVNAQYDLCHSLYEEYHSYMNDSAIRYIDRCITLAEQMGDRNSVEYCQLQLAYQCTESGMYYEAMDILGSIDVNQIGDAHNRQKYYSTLAHLYSELGYYCKVPRLQQAYFATGDQYRQLIDTTVCSIDEALQIKEIQCFSGNDAQGALHYSDLRLKQVEEGSHEYAIVAFYRHLDYRLSGDSVQARYWLTQSALSDVRNAIMDQGAMWEVANMLRDDGDMDRA